MRVTVFWLLLCSALAAAQSSSGSGGSPPAKPPDSPTPASKPTPSRNPNLAPPRSDRVNADAIPDDPEGSSSKDTQIDLSPPGDDAKAHPNSAEALANAEAPGGIGEFHSWDPHKAAKAVEVGDFYFKRKNYIAAESRYREALLYKDNDAVAIFRLAVCLEKMNRLDEAQNRYEDYLKILPHGAEAEQARKALDRLKTTPEEVKPK